MTVLPLQHPQSIYKEWVTSTPADLCHSITTDMAFFTQKSAVGDYIHAADQTKVTTYGEHLPTVAHYITRLTTKGTLDNHALVVDCQTVIADNGTQLT